MNSKKQKLVVVGNGMAGARVVEEILRRAPERFDIVMFGAEPYGNYNRILLSNVLNGSQNATDIFMNPLAWYRDNGIRLHAGVKAILIDREHGVVVGVPLQKDAMAYSVDAAAEWGVPEIEEPYDNVIIATGSRPFVPPMEGFGGPGTFVFRTIDDCARIADYARASRRAAVIGGGLLGLEAARGLMTHGVEVTVLEAAPQLMGAQLDSEAGDILRKTIESMGIKALCNTITTRIVRPNGRITDLEFRDGATLDTDMVVVSAGIRPITETAEASGLTVNRAIVCDDQMRTSDPAIFALGECVEHCGQLYGLVDPIWEQAEVLADVITRTHPDAAYRGSKLGTKLKVMGVELASMGETRPAGPDDEVIVYREPAGGIYKKADRSGTTGLPGPFSLGTSRPPIPCCRCSGRGSRCRHAGPICCSAPPRASVCCRYRICPTTRRSAIATASASARSWKRSKPAAARASPRWARRPRPGRDAVRARPWWPSCSNRVWARWPSIQENITTFPASPLRNPNSSLRSRTAGSNP